MKNSMRLFRYVVTHRELEVHLSIALALVVGVLGLLDVVGAPVVTAATLATLAVMAMSVLVNRRQMGEVERSMRALSEAVRHRDTENVSVDSLLRESTSGAGALGSGMSDVGMLGVTLGRTLRSNYHELEKLLREGARIRVALLDPASGAPEEAARRCGVGHQPEIFQQRLQLSVGLLRQLSATAGPGSVEVRLLPFAPAVGLLVTDPGTGGGRVHLDIYAHRPVGPEPVLVLRRDRDPGWFAHFVDEFERVWANGRAPGPADGFPTA
ncbi:DUF5919 domain-containing protein [Catellatospora sp. NPDC049609]|uniref:DUF5919 domain-containing protein n=1 Tax=Catellatospora sp. NPDC049609 TaxID=3155505 RepID=UPI00342676E4